MTITGNGAAKTIIEAQTCNPITTPDSCHLRRVFEVSSTGNLTLDGVTVRHGVVAGMCRTCQLRRRYLQHRHARRDQQHAFRYTGLDRATAAASNAGRQRWAVTDNLALLQTGSLPRRRHLQLPAGAHRNQQHPLGQSADLGGGIFNSTGGTLTVDEQHPHRNGRSLQRRHPTTSAVWLTVTLKLGSGNSAGARR